jgi:DNA-binding HxlR family transcriptional regulator
MTGPRWTGPQPGRSLGRVPLDRQLIAALKSLTDPTRLRILAALAVGDASVDDLAGKLGVSASTVAHHLARLHAAGIVASSGRWPRARYRLRPQRLNELGRTLDAVEREADDVVPDIVPLAGRELSVEEARVLAGFFEADRLMTIPAQARKRAVVLRYLRDRSFPEDRGYPEKEVNQLLAIFHPDPASLRRYLVDSGLMTRAAGIYRRNPQ